MAVILFLNYVSQSVLHKQIIMVSQILLQLVTYRDVGDFALTHDYYVCLRKLNVYLLNTD
jgi:hypothetical protein